MEQNNKVKVYTSSLGGNLEISVSGMKQTVEATNNRARYYAEQSLKYRDEAKMYAENAQYYADQNADVSKEDLFNLKLELQKEIAAKQDVGNYALKEELPVNVSELKNDVNYVNDKQLLEKVPDQTGCTGQVLITNGEKTSWTGISTFQLFDCKLTDRILDDSETKGWALQGTYVYKDAIAGSRYGYPDFYAKCLEEYNEASTTETVNGKTVKVHSNGHKFYDIADRTGIDEFFSTMGSAWFYGIDTANERIFLPRNKYYSLSLNKDSANVHSRTGSTVDVSTVEMMPYYNTSTGALVTGSDAGVVYPGIDSGGRIDRISNDDSGTHSSYTMGHSLYVDSADIVESNTDYYLYICVGNTVSDTSWVDVVTQVEGGVKDLEDKTNEGIEVLSNASNALRQTQITNCLLEVPQNIKLELADGVLTLKAGSVLIKPNGSGVFEDDNIETDKTFNLADSIDGKYLIFKYDFFRVEKCVSGSTDSLANTTWHIWYDTENNLVKVFTNTAGVIDHTISLPFCLVTVANGVITSIDQVFNGMGYIGSTIWVDKGVKGLFPEGRNTDGTLNNREFVTKSVIVTTKTGNFSNEDIRLNDRQLDMGDLSYNEAENLNTYNGAYRKFAKVGKISTTNGVITSFQPKLPFRAVDYNDKSEISGWGAPSGKYIDLTLGASETSYIAPANGYFYLDKMSTVAGQGFKFRGKDNIIGNKFVSATNSQPVEGCSMLILKGEKVTLWYSLGGTTRQFRFYYAEGEQ